MREIRVFYDNTSYTLTWLRALVWGRKEFLQAGYRIVFDTIDAPIPRMSKILKCPDNKEGYFEIFCKKRYDIVFLAYHHSEAGLCKLNAADRAEVLSFIKNKCNKLVWLDTSDSTGTAMFDVMPFVDLYLKKQILKDRTRYTNPIWSNRVFGEYYHNEFGIEETGTREHQEYSTLDPQYLPKLGISWNVGLGDLFTKGTARFFYRNKYKPVKFAIPKSNTKYIIHYRGSYYPGAVGYQRSKSREMLAMRNDINKPDINIRVAYEEYVQECIDSLALLSPFGWGEICGRDFESFVFGDALLKFDMSHMVTFPNCYIENETYIPLKWDFSDFNEILDKLKTADGKNQALSIAKNGQDLYKNIYFNGKTQFVNHLIKQLEGV